MRVTNKKATLILKGSLGDFRPTDMENTQSLPLYFELHPSLKDILEARGIPHTAVFKVEINGRTESLAYNLQDGDRITAYPYEFVKDSTIAPIWINPKAFVADVHLGKLARTLRLLGFDTAYNSDWEDSQIIEQSNSDHRMILTRDKELLKNGTTQWGYWVRATDPDQQIRELFARFQLAGQTNPFSRCMKCNGMLKKTDKNEVKNEIPPKVRKWHSDYWRCVQCGQVYWKGSHFEKLQAKVEELTAST